MNPPPDGHRSQVGFLFGWLMAKEVPGPLLVHLLELLGNTPQATRTLLSRMQSRGDLTSRKVGRVALYRPAGEFEQQYKQVRRPADPPPWTGAFHTLLYDIPETERAIRDELRRVAATHWFGFPRPGIAIGLTAPDDWLDEVRALVPDSADHLLVTGDMRVEIDVARVLAERAWDLPARAQRLDVAARQMTEKAAGTPPDGPEALLSFQEIWRDRAQVLLSLPPLPAELLPDHWPVREYRQASMAWSAKHFEPLASFRDHTLTGSTYRDLLVPDPDFEFDTGE